MKITNLNAPQQGSLQQVLQSDQTEEAQQVVEPQTPQSVPEAESNLPLNAVAALQAESFDPAFTSTDDEDESSAQTTPAELDSVAQEVFQGLQGSPEQIQPIVSSQETGDSAQQGVPTFEAAEESPTLQDDEASPETASTVTAADIDSAASTGFGEIASAGTVSQADEAPAQQISLQATEEVSTPRLEGTDLPPPMPNLEGSELPPPQPTTLLEANPLPTSIADLDGSAREMLSDLQDPT